MLDTNQPVSVNPSISILIAARNEEVTILACLQAITQLHYSPGSVEVLIGNDQSTDQTAQLVAGFIRERPNFRILNIPESDSGLKGKANVLAQLAKQARGRSCFLRMLTRRFLLIGLPT
ncbi:glycosyltransferase [Spirosoma telluris]|uniref:glycosyltransferase n=1 Tax=Spirosoma telluris TaxID=2183553 RepID=UPI002FC3DCBC